MLVQASVERQIYVNAASGVHSAIVVVPVPANLAARFPDGKYPPHITVCYIGDADDGRMNQITMVVRDVCKRVPWFRCGLDTNRGLKDFGPGSDGYKALWFPAKDDPQTALSRLQGAIRLGLRREGIETEDFDRYVPHATWDYVKNDMSGEEWAATSAFACHRLDDLPLWWDVHAVSIGCPDGTYRTAVLNPIQHGAR